MAEAQAGVRLAEARDLPGLLALYRELRPHDERLSPRDASVVLRRLLSDDDIALVVCDVAGELTATCMLAIVPQFARAGRPFGVIEHVVTASAHRRRGFGRAVLRRALDIAWTRECCKVVLLSGVQRAEARALYASVGFSGDIERGFVVQGP